MADTAILATALALRMSYTDVGEYESIVFSFQTKF